MIGQDGCILALFFVAFFLNLNDFAIDLLHLVMQVAKFDNVFFLTNKLAEQSEGTTSRSTETIVA